MKRICFIPCECNLTGALNCCTRRRMNRCELIGNWRGVSFHEGWHQGSAPALLTAVILPQGCKGRSLLWKLPCMNSVLPWLPTTVLVPLRPPCPTGFSSSHETQDICFRRRGIYIKPCYGLFRQWQWLHFGIQRWWRFQWWSSRNIRVSVYKTVFVDVRGSLPSSVISPEVSNFSQNVLKETTINY